MFRIVAAVLFLSGCSDIRTDILVVGGGTMTTCGVSFPGLFHVHGRQIIGR